MATVTQRELEILSIQTTKVYESLLAQCAQSAGNIEVAEEAIARAISALRTLVVSSGVQVCADVADHAYCCPKCKAALTFWGHRKRTLVTGSGEGSLRASRYRCRSCRKDYYPWQVQHGLDGGNQFTLMAQRTIAEEAADGPFDKASSRLLRMGIPVSAAEVDRICRVVATWRKQEEEVVRIARSQSKSLPLALQDWNRFPDVPEGDDVLVVSIDGAMVRSDEMGDDGLKWFEVRSGIIRLCRKEKPDINLCVAGHMEPDQIFETLRCQLHQAPKAWRRQGRSAPRQVFIADGIPWIWERAEWYFPNCLKVLDIYHAAQHVGEAGRAAYGADSEQTKRWVDGAIGWLKEAGGPRAILQALVHVLRSGQPCDVDQVKTNFRYLWRHRHRMRYHQWREEGLPIGSGAMESTIKQLTAHRMCGAGMMWTKQNADLMLRLRAAHLSGALNLTIERERRIRLNRAVAFRTRGWAEAV